MDRLSAVIGLAGLTLGLAGCDDGSSGGTAAPPSRVVAVAASEDEPAEELCDVSFEGGDAPRLTLPELAEGQEAPDLGGSRWLNVWATWCRPCVEELPLLARWNDRLAEDGVEVEQVFLSADADADAVAHYREEHADAPDGVRIADPQALPEWVTTVGLDEGATLPIHVLTDARGRVRCARTGAVEEDDYERVRDVLRDR
jgi:thiol-disulfide isomerase/thioredoxin